MKNKRETFESNSIQIQNYTEKCLYIIGYKHPLCFLGCFIFAILLMAIIISEIFKN